MQTPPASPSARSSAPSGITAAMRSAPTPPARPPKAAAAATRAISGFAEWGSKRSLRSDQNIDIAIAASTDECTYRSTATARGCLVQQHPFRDEQDSAEPQHGGDHAGRAEPDEKAARRLHCGNGEHGRRADEEREARHREPRQEQRVANRVGRHLLRNQHSGSQERDKRARVSRRGAVAVPRSNVQARNVTTLLPRCRASWPR